MAETHSGNHRSACWIRLLILLFSAIPAIGAQGVLNSPHDASAPVQISVSPNEVVFDVQAGSTADVISDINVSSSDGGPLSYTASVQNGSGSWLALGNVFSGLTVSVASSVSGTAPGTLRVVGIVANVPAGTYSGTIALTAPRASNSPQIIPVSLVVRSQPTLILRPNALQFSHRNGFDYSIPQPQTISVFGGSTDFQVQVCGDQLDWLTVSPTGSTTPADLFVSVDPSGLDSGFYQANISIIAPNAVDSGTATVILIVSDDVPPPTVSPSSISFQAQYGSHQSPSQTLLVSTNDAPVSLSNSAADAAWLSVRVVDQWAGAIDGATQMVLPQPGRLIISADPTGLAPGTYSGQVTIDDSPNGATVPVTLRVVSKDLIVPQVVDGGNWNTVITLVNTDAVPAPFTVKFWQQNGTPMSVSLDGIGTVSSYLDTIPVGGTRILNTTGLGSTISSGWAQVSIQNSVGGTAILRQPGTSGDSEAAVPAAAPPGQSFVLPFDNVAGFQTGLALINPGSSDSTIAVGVRDEDGNQIASDSITLPPHGSQASFLQDKYPQLVNRRGEVKFDSKTDISAVGLRFSPGSTLTWFQPVVSGTGDTNDVTTRSIPQISDGNGWKTTLFLVNPGNNPVPFSIAFWDPTTPGALLNLPILGVGTLSEYSDVIPAGGMRTIETPGIADSLVQGWAEIVSSGPIAGTVAFAQTGSGADVEASMQIQPAPGENFMLPFDNTDGYTTGMAFLDADQSNWTGLVIVRDENGQKLDIEYFEMGGNVYQTFPLTDQFPSTNGIRGTIEFLGVSVSALEYRVNPFGAFTLLTPIPK